MFRVAICGGIGSGKSAVTSILRDLGADVVVADEVNAELMTDPLYVEKINHIFPSVVHNHCINKKELASIVYRDEKKRRALMDLAHPLIYERMFAKYKESKLVFYEIPLFSESAFTFFARAASTPSRNIIRSTLRSRSASTYQTRSKVKALSEKSGIS